MRAHKAKLYFFLHYLYQWFNPMFCQWFNPLEHLSASSSNSEVNSHPVHGLIHAGAYTFINSISGLICRKLITLCWLNSMFCQWFNPLEHLSISSEDKSYPVHGLIHQGTQSKTVFIFFNNR